MTICPLIHKELDFHEKFAIMNLELLKTPQGGDRLGRRQRTRRREMKKRRLSSRAKFEAPKKQEEERGATPKTVVAFAAEESADQRALTGS